MFSLPHPLSRPACPASRLLSYHYWGNYHKQGDVLTHSFSRSGLHHPQHPVKYSPPYLQLYQKLINPSYRINTKVGYNSTVPLFKDATKIKKKKTTQQIYSAQ